MPGSLDRPWVVVFANVRHGFTSGHAVEHRHAGECGTGPSAAATTGNLYALCASTMPRFVQCNLGVAAVDGQPKVRPTDPPHFPWHGLRQLAEQVEPEVRDTVIGPQVSQATSTDEPT